MAGTSYPYKINKLPPMTVNVEFGHRVRLRLWIARKLIELAAWVLQAKETHINEVDVA